MSYPITVLWSVPRSVSTSFERMMTARGDHAVLDEPFSRYFYLSEERRSRRYETTVPHSLPQQLLQEINDAAQDRPVFVKDLAYQASVIFDDPQVREWRSTFLVRDPAATIPSLARKWPDFTDEETGWDALGRAFDLFADDRTPVLDAEALCADPERVLRAWCEAMDIPYLESALTWEPGFREEWHLWADWHNTTSSAGGFTELEPVDPPAEDAGRLREAYERALPVYERLAARAIR